MLIVVKRCDECGTERRYRSEWDADTAADRWATDWNPPPGGRWDVCPNCLLNAEQSAYPEAVPPLSRKECAA